MSVVSTEKVKGQSIPGKIRATGGFCFYWIKMCRVAVGLYGRPSLHLKEIPNGFDLTRE